MRTTLRDSGAIRLDEAFWPYPEALYATLVTAVPWDDRLRARKAMSYGVPYNYSGIEWPAAEFPPFLLAVLQRVAAQAGFVPNNCLAHYYPDGRSTMGFHSDSTAELEPGTGIAIVSLGAARHLTFRNEADRSQRESYLLPPGSLFLMSGAMQAGWKHGLLAEEVTGGRVSLTFRRMAV
jgi:alkylated DNA repair dioxygenase AlkB